MLVKCIFLLPRGIIELCFTLQIQKKLLYVLKALPSHYWDEFAKRYPLWLCVFKALLHHYHLLCYFPAFVIPKYSEEAKDL